MKARVSFLVAALLMLVLCVCASKLRGEPPSDKLIAALIKAESGGDDNAVGDKDLAAKAYGCLQIRQPCMDDYNAAHGTKFKASDCLGNRELSVKVCQWYLDHYTAKTRLGRSPTDEDKARVWNGGPVGCFDNGAIDKDGTVPKSEKARSRIVRLQTNAKAYWSKVRQRMEK